MKKLIILLLAFVPVGIFAQNSQDVYTLKNDNINNTYADIGNAFLGDNKVVFASPKEELAHHRDKNNSKTLFDPAVEELNTEDWLIINKNLFEDNDFDIKEGMVSFTKDKKTVYFSVNRKIKNRKRENEKEVKTRSSVNLQLFKAHVKENGEWINLEMLPFNGDRFSTGQPVLNQDDTKLYFVSDGPESLGRTDIFVVDLYKGGTYGKPVNLGPEINSSEREIFPFIDYTNVLYFSSDVSNEGRELDVFACKIFDNTISRPIKLGASVNGEKGNDYRYAFASSPSIEFECQQEISGFVKNIDTHELLPGVQMILFDKNDKELQSFLSGETDASFSFRQTCNTSFKLKAYLDGYLIGELDIKTVNDLNADPFEIVMNMSVDPGSESGLMVDSPKQKDTEDLQNVVATVETDQFTESIEDSVPGSYYDFNSDKKVYTVQIGAFLRNGQTDKYLNLTSLFNHQYDDGFNRYYSGIFESYSEAKNYLKLMKKDGYDDAFVVGLNGEKRF